MTKKNIKTKAATDLESRVNNLEKRIAALEQLSKRSTRKKREYTSEEKVTIRARLLAGQEAARKRRENDIDDITIIKPASDKPIKPKNTVKAKPVSLPKPS